MTPTCPTPHKKRYATRSAAEIAGRRSQISLGQILHPYPCACSWWHCSKTPPNPAITGTADAIDVQRLMAIPDIAFRGIVAEDVAGKGNLADRLALRHPSNLKRWRQMLGQLIQDLCEQYRDRKGDQSLEAHDWRKRSAGYEASLRVALSECQQRQAAEQVRRFEEAAARREESRSRYDKVIGPAEETASIPSQNELRRMAGDVAIDRLIKAHGQEFSQYLAEECVRVGAVLPDRIRKYLPKETAS